MKHSLRSLIIRTTIGGAILLLVAVAVRSYASPASPHSVFVWPTDGYLGYIYGRNGHNGLDIWTNTSGTGNEGSRGNPIYPPYVGTVTAYYYDPRGALQGLRIVHGNVNGTNTWTHYFHMADEATGQSYVQGGLLNQPVGLSTFLGNQGDRIWNPGDQIVHLHLTVANGPQDANAIDPSPYFDSALNWNDPNHVG